MDREAGAKMRKAERKDEMDRAIDTGSRVGAQLSWMADRKSYAFTSVVVAFLLAVFTALLPAAA